MLDLSRKRTVVVRQSLSSHTSQGIGIIRSSSKSHLNYLSFVHNSSTHKAWEIVEKHACQSVQEILRSRGSWKQTSVIAYQILWGTFSDDVTTKSVRSLHKAGKQ